jgi:hypothetical protein
MRPSSRELLEGIAGALERQVAPAILDKWAASVLRSAVQLLGHLASRVEDEARILEEDNADARRVLTKMASRIAANRPRVAPLADAVAQALQAEETPSSDVVRLTRRSSCRTAPSCERSCTPTFRGAWRGNTTSTSPRLPARRSDWRAD